MKTLLILSVLFLSGCMTTREHIINGEKMYQVSCNGTARTYIDCQTEASKKCAETNQNFAPVNSDGQITYRSANGGFGALATRSLLFKCVDREVQNVGN